MDTDKTLDVILTALAGKSLTQSLEILGNTLISLGVHHMNTSEVIAAKDLYSVLIDDRKRHKSSLNPTGETVANATLAQGLILLTWLGDSNDTSRNLQHLQKESSSTS